MLSVPCNGSSSSSSGGTKGHTYRVAPRPSAKGEGTEGGSDVSVVVAVLRADDHGCERIGFGPPEQIRFKIQTPSESVGPGGCYCCCHSGTRLPEHVRLSDGR